MLFEFNLSFLELRNGINKMNKNMNKVAILKFLKRKKNGMAGAEERL